MKATTSILLDKRTSNKKNEFPVKLRVIHDRINRLYSTGYFLTNENFERTFDQKSKGKWKEIRISLNRIEQRAISIINESSKFSFEIFKKKFVSPGSYSKNVRSLFNQYVDFLNSEQRIGTAISYGNARDSISNYKRNINIDNITANWLKGYENWMIGNRKSLATIGIYARSLRTIYNNAIHEGLVSREDYPFGKRGYKIPTGSNIKKALKAREMKRFFQYVPENEGQDRAKDFFIISYLSNGANLTDLARLQNHDIDNREGHIIFLRSKTRNTVENLKPIVIELIPELARLIDKWGNQLKSDQDYVFDILKPGLSELEKRKKVMGFNRNLNRRLKNIGKKLEFDDNFSMYTARHSYASILKNSGASKAFIGEAMGHSSLKTTESYLASFEKDTRKKWAEVLTRFN